MKAITLTQPWATLVALEAKVIETRGWGTDYRGVIAIHAAKKFPSDARYFVTEEPFATALGGLRPAQLPTSVVVAVATITSCRRFNDESLAKIRQYSAIGQLPPYEGDFGNYAAGRYGIRFKDVHRLEAPVDARGMLGLWNVPADVEAKIRRQIGPAAAGAPAVRRAT